FSESHIKNKKYHIEFGYNRRPIRVEKQAVHLADEHQIIPYFYPGKQDTRDINTDKNVTFFNRDLNQEQKRAVRNILIPKSVPYVIFGPPGTGKTVTVVESVLQIWKNDPGARVLICAPSNAAADEVAIRLVDTIPHMDIFRLLGTIYGSHEEKRMQKIRPITNVGEDGVFYMPSMETLLKYRVLLTTIVTAAKLVNGGVPEGHFSYVFIDESGYVTETQTLIPIAGILSNAGTKGKIQGKIVLAGDPRQLGALVHSNFVKHCGYGKSMIERLLDTCEIYSKEGTQSYDARYVTKLVKNYRSHKTILEIPNRLFYDNELIPAGDHFTKFFIGWEHLKNKEFPIIFHHVEGTDSREKDSPR
ncbi:putative helicase mov-10-B.1, partial [Gonioctena quinquepunctata]